MPKFLEQILEQAAAKHGLSGKAADRYTFGAMNNMGAMHGSQETAKGEAMDAKHERDMGKGMPKLPSMPHPHRNLGRYLHTKKGRGA